MSGTTILVILAAAAAAMVLLLFRRRDRPRRIGYGESHTTARQRMESAAPDLPAADIAEIGRLLAAGRKIEAIKLVRARTGLRLKEAKEFVEHRDFGGGR
jgi:ribosomal protein L7/L12